MAEYDDKKKPVFECPAAVEWVRTNPYDAPRTLCGRALVGGHEAGTGDPLWVIRAEFEGDLVPGKLSVYIHTAYVPWGGKENTVQEIEVCCVSPHKVQWVQTEYDHIPHKAIVGGYTRSGETLYIGRAREQGSLTPGKVQPSLKAMYISYDRKEILFRHYEILCRV